MQHGQDSRIFENQTAPQILEEVFREALRPLGREARLNLSRTYPVREYCVQYKESDWNFVQRLMADEGIAFYIDDGKQEADRETLVLVDSNDSFPEIETMGSEERPADPLPPSAPATRDLRLRLNIDPADARHRHDRFTLIGRGAGGYRRTLSLKDDQRPGDEYVDLIFPDLSAGMRYSLQMTFGDSKAPQLLFSDVPFEQLFEE
jgi:hypothetical protein